MSDCYMHELQSYSIAMRLLSKTSKGNSTDLEWASNVMDVVDELKDVFQPLSADLIIRCRDKKIKWCDKSLKPPFPTWFICEYPIPESVILESWFTNPQISQVRELSRKALMDWIEKALQQDCGNPETHEPGWYTLFINAVRARIFDQKSISDRLTFFVNARRVGDLRYPLEKRHGSYWVYAPIQYYTTQPPLRLEITNTEGAINLSILVNWSLWTTPGTAENTAFRQALSRIVTKGWTLTHTQDVFQI